MLRVINEYENLILLINERLKCLKEQSFETMPVDDINILRARIESLQTEKYELMKSIAMMKKYFAPKTPTPSISDIRKITMGERI